MELHYLTPALLQAYETFLNERERAPATICKYRADLSRFFCETQGRPITKELVVGYKKLLLARHTASSANSILAAINGLLAFLNWQECRVNPIKVQAASYRDNRRELTCQEYYRLLRVAKDLGRQRLYYVLQTICSTGIRISELRFITVAAVASGQAEVRNKGKSRRVFLPKILCVQLKNYCRQCGVTHGSIFVTRTGRPLDRSNVWAAMKALCSHARVEAKKVFPHNLRHLFAVTFYRKERDLDHLAAILGHSNINTTRVYSMTSGGECRRQIERLNLIM